MKIATNIPALQARASISKTTIATESASGKLSSGLRINKSADDLTGMAISARMKAQIRGSARASQNTMDGISLVQTADGALQEVHDMLQRMRELSVQASNGTYTDSDLKKIQMEIDELKEEITAVSSRAEFNKIKLFDGTADLHTMGINADVVSITSTVELGEYKMNLIESGTKALYTPSVPTNTELKFPSDQLSGTITINGKNVEIYGTDTLLDTQKKLMALADECGLVLTQSNDGASIASIEAKEPGSKTEIEIGSNNSKLLAALGIDAGAVYTPGTDATVELIRNSKDPTSAISDSATYTVDGDTITILDINNQRIVAKMIGGIGNNSIGDFVSNLRDEILKRQTAVHNIDSRLAELRVSINSVTTSAEVDAIADEIMTLNHSMIKEFTEARDIMNDATSRFPELTTYPEYGPALAFLTVHDGHHMDFYNDSVSSIAQAKSSIASGDLASTRSSLDSAISSDGLIFCANAVVDSAEKIVKDTMAVIDGNKGTTQCTINVSDGGLMLQVGANEGMQLKLNIARVTAQTLGVDKLEIDTYAKAQEAIMACDYAIGRISDSRAMLGSYQNRLTYTEANLSSIETNLTKSLSTIQDSDLAVEMAEVTRNNALQQAGMFVLSQANQKPQELLQLLK